MGGTGDRFTAFATYAGTATSSYVKGYTVTADYVGTVSRIALNRVRYVAIFEGRPIAAAIEPIVAEAEQTAERAAAAGFPWHYLLVPLGVVAFAGVGAGAALTIKRRGETVETEES